MSEIEINGIKYIPKNESNQDVPKNKKGMEYCIVRTYSAGVFAGWYDTRIKGQEGTIYNARRLWYWDGAASLSELAVNGTRKPENCKFPVEVKKIILKQIIEIIVCTKKGKDSIEGVPVWSATQN